MDLDSPLFLIYYFLILFIIIFIGEFIINKIRLKKKKYDSITLISYVCKKFKINKNKIDYQKELVWVAAINGFIISLVGTVVSSFDTYIVLELGIGFVLLFLLIYSLYEIYGRHLVRKMRRDKNEF